MTMRQHIPILVAEIVEALRVADPSVERVIDGTVGGGGHTLSLLQAGVDQVLACDLDSSAITHARRRLADYRGRVSFFHGSYIAIGDFMRELGWESVDAILLDLGLSSLQLDDPQRGFSFRFDSPLDMRFNDKAETTARDLVNNLPETELARLFFKYGEERHARRIARAAVKQRPIETTAQLAQLALEAIPAGERRRLKIHPATKVFQALRIAVNEELAALEQVIPLAVDLLRPGGRLAIIAFHSLEDRIVKLQLRELSTTVIAPPGMASIEERRARLNLVQRKPIRPDPAETEANPRSRSAKLRVAEKLE